jgi:hypothetical protein
METIAKTLLAAMTVFKPNFGSPLLKAASSSLQSFAVPVRLRRCCGPRLPEHVEGRP